MALSIFDLFSIGIGPSSSHTVGPMRAARAFIDEVQKNNLLKKVYYVQTDLFGSLALTGKGHGTNKAVIMGLSGARPEEVDPETIETFLEEIEKTNKLNFAGIKEIKYSSKKDIIFHYDKQLPYHPNGMRFTAFDKRGREVLQRVYYSVGGGFIVDHESAQRDAHIVENTHKLPFPFQTAEELLEICAQKHMTIQDVMMSNEKSWRNEKEIKEGIFNIWQVMQDCIHRGIHTSGILPGGLNVKRRARTIYQTLHPLESKKPLSMKEYLEWVSLFALAVNEENAAGGRVVTAPTNGAAGVIPAVLMYYQKFTEKPTEQGIIDFFLVAGAIGILYKEGASISAAEMGCMGEVGVACSMAAAGLTAALGGTLLQIENAAEIGMEHNLGLTCDPVMGLVQIPCIERNTMGAIKAINACYLALQGDGTHRVTLAQVIETMRQTGQDMQTIYKETSLGGLAVNVPEC